MIWLKCGSHFLNGSNMPVLTCTRSFVSPKGDGAFEITTWAVKRRLDWALTNNVQNQVSPKPTYRSGRSRPTTTLNKSNHPVIWHYACVTNPKSWRNHLTVRINCWLVRTKSCTISRLSTSKLPSYLFVFMFVYLSSHGEELTAYFCLKCRGKHLRFYLFKYMLQYKIDPFNIGTHWQVWRGIWTQRV